MNMKSDRILVERPALSVVLVALVSALAYVGIQVALDSSIELVETATFVAIFTVVYAGGTWVLREQMGSAGEEHLGDVNADAAETTGDTEAAETAATTAESAAVDAPDATHESEAADAPESAETADDAETAADASNAADESDDAA